MQRVNEDDENVVENASKVAKLRIGGGGSGIRMVVAKEMGAVNKES
jgi:hypothetical protein